MKKLVVISAAVGAALSFLLDPVSGRRRRTTLGQRVPAFFRHRGRAAGRLARGATAEAYGLKQKVTHLREEEKPQPNDPTLAAKVETKLFRDADVPKGQINVSAENGVVVLRGEVSRPELIDDLVERARSVKGVRDVQNLLHLPGTRAPTQH